MDFFINLYSILGLNQKLLINSSKFASKAIKSQIKFVQDGIGSIKEIILTDNQETFINKYEQADLPLRKAIAKAIYCICSPRFGIEGMAIISIVFLTVF